MGGTLTHIDLGPPAVRVAHSFVAIWPGLTQERVQWPRARCSPERHVEAAPISPRGRRWYGELGCRAFATLIRAARLPRPADPQVRSSQVLAQRPGHTSSVYLSSLSRVRPPVF